MTIEDLKHAHMMATRPLRVLVAEDDDITREMVVALLRKIGFVPECTRNGKEAVQQALNKSYDLILMDMKMPVMDGIQAVKAIQEVLNKEGLPPIVGVTAHILPEDTERFRQAGVDTIIAKPISLERLMNSINRTMQEQVITLDASKSQQQRPLYGDSELFAANDYARNLTNDYQLMQDLLDIFEEDFSRQLQALGKYIEEQSAQDIYLVLHSMIGTASNVRATALQSLLVAMHTRLAKCIKNNLDESDSSSECLPTGKNVETIRALFVETVCAIENVFPERQTN